MQIILEGKEEAEMLIKLFKELEFRRKFMSPIDELYEDEDDYPTENIVQYFDRKFYNLEAQIINNSLIIERIEQSLRPVHKGSNEPPCEHNWVTDISSTSGTVYKCSKCGHYKHVSNTASSGFGFTVDLS